MSRFPFRLSLAAAALLISAAGTGCNIAPPTFKLNAGDILSADLTGAIVFQTEPAALDEPGAPPAALRLHDATINALRTDPRIQSAIAKIRVAQADAHQSRLLPNPVLNIAIRFAEGGGTPTIEASVAADLLAILQRPGRVSVADNRLRAATADALIVVLEVWRDLQERYAAAQAAHVRVDQLRQVVDATQQYHSRAQARLDRGEATRLDVSSLAAQRLDFQLQLTEAQNDLRKERLRLARLVGTPSDPAKWELDKLLDPTAATFVEFDLIRSALRHRAEIQAAHWELAALGADARLAHWYLTDDLSPGLDAERDGNWTVGPSLSVPIPLFDWGQARREKTTALIWQARHELLGRERLIVEETRVAYATFTASRDAARRIRDELISLHRQRREDTDAAFAAGVLDVTALVLAERDLQDAQTRLADLEHKTRLAFIDLQHAVGGPAVLAGSTTTAPAQSGTRPASTQPNASPQ